MVQTVKLDVFNSPAIYGYYSLAELAEQNTDVTSLVAAVLADGYAIYVPFGTWEVSTLSIPANGVLFGEGAGCILKQKNASNSTMLTLANDAALFNFEIDGNKANQAGSARHSVYISAASRAKVEHLTIRNSKGSGIAIAGSSRDVRLHKNEITGHVESGIRVYQGTNISSIDNTIYTSDVASTLPGYYLGSDGNSISNVSSVGDTIRGCTNIGFSIVGSGSRNVSNVSISNAKILNNSSHGVYCNNAEAIVQVAGMVVSNGGDGIRLEGDVQQCRISEVITKSNTSFGAREVTSGSTPNFNGFIYLVNTNNGNNTGTVVGANSYVKTS